MVYSVDVTLVLQIMNYGCDSAMYGENGFQTAYGKLGLLQVLLLKGTLIQVLSNTLPDHILATIKEHLAILCDALKLQLSMNCPNITYVILIIETPPNFKNPLFFDSINFPSTHGVILKTFIVYNSKQEVTDTAAFIKSKLLPPLQNHGLVKHYHSDMSVKYLHQTFKDFS